MKYKGKIITLFLISVLLIFTFCACSDSSDANSIKNAYINEKGELVLNYTNGSSDNLGLVVGQNGKDGANGQDGKDGQNGQDGKDGLNGKDGEITVIKDDHNLAIAASKAARSAVDVIIGNEGAGSGVIYKYNEEDDGYFIITNYHVVYSKATKGISEEIQVLLYGNEYLEGLIDATYIGGSMNYDIAILYVENNDIFKDSACTPVSVADSNYLSIGDTVLAFGNSQGEGLSVTSGIVSVDSETLDLSIDEKTETQYRVLRTDTAINHGNSGGGLFNDKGELVGIVNAKLISASVEGMGYAIPSTLACNVADNIIDNCYKTNNICVKRALLGITVSNNKSISMFNPETGKISIVETIYVVSSSPTCLFGTGIKENDVIKSIVLDGKDELMVTRQFHVIDYLLQARVGDTGTLTVERLNAETNETEEVKLTFEITEGSIVDYN